MIDQHHENAKINGVKIVHSCGFDSIPSDMGVYFTQRESKAQKGQLVNKIEILVTKNTLPNPLLLPGRMLVIPYTWLEQEQSFKNFKIIIIKSFFGLQAFSLQLSGESLSL